MRSGLETERILVRRRFVLLYRRYFVPVLVLYRSALRHLSLKLKWHLKRVVAHLPAIVDVIQHEPTIDGGEYKVYAKYINISRTSAHDLSQPPCNARYNRSSAAV